MITPRSYFVAALISFVPYLGLSWGYMKLVEGSGRDFTLALGVLVAARLFFAAVEAIGSSLAWRLYTRKALVADQVERFRAIDFPRRMYAHDDFTDHLARIEGDPDVDQTVREVARAMERDLLICENMGILAGMRMHSAMEAAFEIYSPKSKAKH